MATGFQSNVYLIKTSLSFSNSSCLVSFPTAFNKHLAHEKDLFCCWKMFIACLPAQYNFIVPLSRLNSYDFVLQNGSIEILVFLQVKALLPETSHIRFLVLPILIFMNKKRKEIDFSISAAKSRFRSIVTESRS